VRVESFDSAGNPRVRALYPTLPQTLLATFPDKTPFAYRLLESFDSFSDDSNFPLSLKTFPSFCAQVDDTLNDEERKRFEEAQMVAVLYTGISLQRQSSESSKIPRSSSPIFIFIRNLLLPLLLDSTPQKF
jgi:hypothetical protein